MRCFWKTSVAFEKEFSLKAKAYLAKRLFDSIEVLNLRKNILYLQMERKSSIEYSVVFLVEGEKFRLRNLPSRTSSLFSSWRRACPVLKHNRVSF